MEFRALHPEELEAWLDHVTSVFTGRTSILSLITGITIRGGMLRVSASRLIMGLSLARCASFIRKIFLHGAPITVWAASARSARAQNTADAASLHNSSKIRSGSWRLAILLSLLLFGSQKIYAIEGWEKVSRYYARQFFHCRKTVRVGSPSEPILMMQSKLHGSLISMTRYARKFNGTLVRDEIAYWTKWVQTESSNAWVAERDGTLEGYISVIPRDR